MTRTTDIKRLWDVLMILKQEEDIDDVRKVEERNPDWRKKQQQQVEDVSSGKIKFENPGSAVGVMSVPSSQKSPPPWEKTPKQKAAQVEHQHQMQILNDPLTQFKEEQELAATEGGRHKKQIAGDKFVQGVRSKGLGGGRPAPKVDSQLPLELSSVKKSNESKVLRIFRKYGF